MDGSCQQNTAACSNYILRQIKRAKKHTCRSLKRHTPKNIPAGVSNAIRPHQHESLHLNLLTRPANGDLDFNPPHPVTFLRDRLWRFAALVIGTPSHSIFFEEHIFKPGNVTTISYSVKEYNIHGASVPATTFIVVALLDLDAGLLCAVLLWRLLLPLRSPLYF